MRISRRALKCCGIWRLVTNSTWRHIFIFRARYEPIRGSLVFNHQRVSINIIIDTLGPKSEYTPLPSVWSSLLMWILRGTSENSSNFMLTVSVAWAPYFWLPHNFWEWARRWNLSLFILYSLQLCQSDKILKDPVGSLLLSGMHQTYFFLVIPAIYVIL